MRVFILGVTGRTGSRLAHILLLRGDDVRGLVRRADARDQLAARGIHAVVGDLLELTAQQLDEAFADAEVVVYCMGTEGDDVALTSALDFDGVMTSLTAAGSRRFVLMSAMPEAWRDRYLSAELEHYFAPKKRADVHVARSRGDWVILRPSELTDDVGDGRVSVGAAEPHGSVSRDDVAGVLAEIVHRLDIRRRILELNRGDTPINEALQDLTVAASP